MIRKVFDEKGLLKVISIQAFLRYNVGNIGKERWTKNIKNILPVLIIKH